METTDYLKFIAALIFVVALMGGLSLILRRLYGYGNQTLMPHKRRLKVIESLPIDPRRKLVLIQHDNKEHLILLGNSNETVLTGNLPAQTPNAQTSSVPQPNPDNTNTT